MWFTEVGIAFFGFQFAKAKAWVPCVDCVADKTQVRDFSLACPDRLLREALVFWHRWFLAFDGSESFRTNWVQAEFGCDDVQASPYVDFLNASSLWFMEPCCLAHATRGAVEVILPLSIVKVSSTRIGLSQCLDGSRHCKSFLAV